MQKRKLIVILAAVLSIGALFIASLSYFTENFTEAGISNTVDLQINGCIQKYLETNEILFNEITENTYGTDGKLTEIKINSYKLNKIKAELRYLITNELQSIKSRSVYIPLVNLLNIKLLSGGPKIKTNIVPIGTVTVDTINEMESVGINHTVHRIELQFTLRFKAIMPYDSISFESKFNVILCESLIIGEVPDFYVS